MRTQWPLQVVLPGLIPPPIAAAAQQEIQEMENA
jgi:hypothetical protein